MGISAGDTQIYTSSEGPVNGPLGALYTNPFGGSILQYPDDLGSAQKGHVVTFTACETQPLTFSDVASTFTPSNTPPAEETGPSDSSFTGVTQNTDEQTNLTFQPKRLKSSDVIQLYMPDTINFQYNADYSDTSLLQAAESLPGVLGRKAKAVTSVVDSDATKFAGSAAGYAINPQQQLLFTGIGFRTFQFAFTFTPSSVNESAAVQNIIYKFRYHAAPKMQTGAAGMAFIVPDSFIIQFQQLGKGENTNITKLKESVLKSVDVNYSPNGIWSAHPDGSPTQVNLTLQFQEIALVDKTAIYNGY